MKTYKQTKELNPKTSASTGTICCYSGPHPYARDPGEQIHKVVVSSCNAIAILHDPTAEMMLSKVDLLIGELKAYKKFLKKQSKK